MKTRRIFGILFAILLTLSLAVNASGALWPATSLTGGVPDDSLDEIDGALLSEGHGAIVIIDGYTYTYYLDATSGALAQLPEHRRQPVRRDRFRHPQHGEGSGDQERAGDA